MPLTPPSRAHPPRTRRVLAAAAAFALATASCTSSSPSEPQYEPVTPQLCDEIDVTPILDTLEMTLEEGPQLLLDLSSDTKASISCRASMRSPAGPASTFVSVSTYDDPSDVDVQYGITRDFAARPSILATSLNSQVDVSYRFPAVGGVDSVGEEADAFAGELETGQPLPGRSSVYSLAARDRNLILQTHMEVITEEGTPAGTLAELVQSLAVEVLALIPTTEP